MVLRPEELRGLFFKDVMPLRSTQYEELLSLPIMEEIEIDRLHKQRMVNVVKYLVMMYDINTPLISRYTDLEERKQKAIEVSGLDIYNQKELIHNLVTLQDDDIIFIIAQMLKKQGENQFSMLISQEHFFSELLRSLMEPVDSDRDKDKVDALVKKGRLSAEIQQVSDRIEEIRARYFRGDGDLEKKVRANYQITPESIARMSG